MPLNNSQAEAIEATISHLLVFTPPFDFKNEKSLLNEAITNALLGQKPFNSEHKYYWIYKPLLEPAVYFKLVKDYENPKSPTTIGEVQAHIIHFISKQLDPTGLKLNEWEEKLIKLVPSANHARIFEKAPDVPEEHPYVDPYVLTHLDNKIYTAKLNLDQTQYQDVWDKEEPILLRKPRVETTINHAKIHSSALVPLGPWVKIDFKTDEEEDDFIENQKMYAQLYANNFAAECVLKYLIEKKLIDDTHHSDIDSMDLDPVNTPVISDSDETMSRSEDDESGSYGDETFMISENLEFDSYGDEATNKKEQNYYLSLYNNEAIKLIITTTYYFDQLILKNISLNDLAELDIDQAQCLNHPVIIKALKNHSLDFDRIKTLAPDQLTNLSCPAIIDLINKNIITFEQALAFSKQQISIITCPAYYYLILNNKLNIIDIDNTIDDAQVKFLMLPTISSLIQKGKLRFQDAKKLPIHFARFASSPLYNGFLSNHHLPLDVLTQMQKNHYDFVLHKDIAPLITNNIIAWQDILNLSPIAMHRLKCITKSYPFLHDWLKQKVITSCTLNKTSLIDVCAEGYAKRLYSISMKKTYQGNNKSDTFDDVLNEMQITNKNMRELILPFTSLNQFKIKIAHQLLLLIKEDLKCMPIAYTNNFKNISSWIDTYENSSSTPHWLDCLKKCIDCAKQMTINKIVLLNPLDETAFTQSHTLFSTGQSSHLNKLKMFCNGLISLSNFTSPTVPIRHQGHKIISRVD